MKIFCTNISWFTVMQLHMQDCLVNTYTVNMHRKFATSAHVCVVVRNCSSFLASVECSASLSASISLAHVMGWHASPFSHLPRRSRQHSLVCRWLSFSMVLMRLWSKCSASPSCRQSAATWCAILNWRSSIFRQFNWCSSGLSLTPT